MLTGRLSLAAMPWLADHAVRHGPAARHGVRGPGGPRRDLAGCGTLEELTLQEPLVLPSGGVQLQVQVGDSDGDSGRRTVTVSSREGEGEWVRHAVGVLAPAMVGPFRLRWRLGLRPVRSRFRSMTPTRFAQRGYGYGPAFQGLRQVWRAGDTVYAEADLPQGIDSDAA
ncbi:polyketide synthase dehydratase domain-containing protein, partial [Streptomyces cellostaticus]|uniref:polyketide synthase dehydratase domain-containing protein n=1 Tax=Streptomyces cellostaticus TaxID=67285 RepID=UPI00295E5DCE